MPTQPLPAPGARTSRLPMNGNRAGSTTRCSRKPTGSGAPSGLGVLPWMTTLPPTTVPFSTLISEVRVASPTVGLPTSVAWTTSPAMMSGVTPVQHTPPGWLTSSRPSAPVVPVAVPIMTPLRRTSTRMSVFGSSMTDTKSRIGKTVTSCGSAGGVLIAARADGAAASEAASAVSAARRRAGSMREP